jgi:hypothetical protein
MSATQARPATPKRIICPMKESVSTNLHECRVIGQTARITRYQSSRSTVPKARTLSTLPGHATLGSTEARWMPTVEASQPASRLGERNRMMSLRPSAELDAQGCAQLTVRPAIADDMPYLLDAFEYALSPYYGGDHVAHAHRVIQTHLAGGTDPRGLLSARQLVLILWEGSRRRGVLNLVFKR